MQRANAFCGAEVVDSEAAEGDRAATTIEKILGEAAEAGEIRPPRDR